MMMKQGKGSDEEYGMTTVRMTKEGSVLEVLHCVGWDVGIYGFDSSGNLVWVIYTNDEKRAIKATNEKRIELIANNLWG